MIAWLFNLFMLCFALAQHLLCHLHSRLIYRHVYLFGASFCLSHLSYQALVLQMRIQAALTAEWTLQLNKRSLVTLCFRPCAGRTSMLWWPIDCMCCLETENKGRLERRGERRLQTDEWPEDIIICCSQTRRTRGLQQHCQVGSLEKKWKEKCAVTWLSYSTRCYMVLWRPWLQIALRR